MFPRKRMAEPSYNTVNHSALSWWRNQMKTFSALLHHVHGIVLGIHRSPVTFHHKGQWRGALMFPLICTWTNGWINKRDAGDLRRHRVHYDVTVMITNWQWLVSDFVASFWRNDDVVITSCDRWGQISRSRCTGICTEERGDYFLATLMFNSIHGLVPAYLCNQVVMNRDINGHNARDSDGRTITYRN